MQNVGKNICMMGKICSRCFTCQATDMWKFKSRLLLWYFIIINFENKISSKISVVQNLIWSFLSCRLKKFFLKNYTHQPSSTKSGCFSLYIFYTVKYFFLFIAFVHFHIKKMYKSAQVIRLRSNIFIPAPIAVEQE